MSYFISVGLAGEIWKFTPTSTWGQKVSGVANTLYSVHGTVDGSFIIATGSGSTLLHSTDHGETWIDLTPTAPAPGRFVTGVWVFSPILAYACCHDNAGTGWVWKWNGAAWAIDYGPIAQGDFHGIWAAAIDDIYVVAHGGGPGTCIRHYNGIAWANDAAAVGAVIGTAIYGNAIGTKVWFKTINPDNTLYEGSFGAGTPPVDVGDPQVLPNYGNAIWVNSAEIVYVAGFDGAANDTLLMSWNGFVMAPEVAPGDGNTLGGVYGVADNSILTVSRSVFGGTCRCWWYNGAAWNAVPIAAAVTMQGVWGMLGSTVVSIITDETSVIASDLLKITFSTPLAVTSVLRDPNTYTIVPVSSGAKAAVVQEVLGIEDRTTSDVSLIVSRLILGETYRITIPIETIHSSGGLLNSGIVITDDFVARETKVDLILNGIAGMYDIRSRSTIRSLLESVSMSDEEIGGNS